MNVQRLNQSCQVSKFLDTNRCRKPESNVERNSTDTLSPSQALVNVPNTIRIIDNELSRYAKAR